MGPEDGSVGEEFDQMGTRTTDIWVIVGQTNGTLGGGHDPASCPRMCSQTLVSWPASGE